MEKKIISHINIDKEYNGMIQGLGILNGGNS